MLEACRLPFFRSSLLVTGVLLLFFLLGLIGIKWGIPGEERSMLFYDDAHQEAKINDHSEALHSYHPDEPHIFMAINNMVPENFDFNPRYFVYPTFYIYSVAASLATGLLTGLLESPQDKLYYFIHPEQVGMMYILARIVTILMGCGVILATFFLGCRLYNNRATGLLAAGILAVCPLFVVHASYVTVDVPVTFWMTVSLLCSAWALKTSDWRAYLVAGLTAGLATATKYYGGIVAVSLLTAHTILFFQNHRIRWNTILSCYCHWKLIVAGLFIVLGFFIGCPYAFLAPHDFLNEGIFILTDAMQLDGIENYELIYGYWPAPFFFHIYASLFTGMGPLFGFLSLPALIFALYRRRPADLILLSVFISYFLLIGCSNLRPMRYAIPLFPLFALFLARSVCALHEQLSKSGRKWASSGGTQQLLWGVFIVIWLGTLAISWSYKDSMRTGDSRTDAAKWIQRNVQAGATIGMASETVDFYSVPMNPYKYRFLTIGFNKEALCRESPDLFVTTEIEYRDYLRAEQDYPQEATFINNALSDKLTCPTSHYESLKFVHDPILFDRRIRHGVLSHDWLYPITESLILQRIPKSPQSRYP